MRIFLSWSGELSHKVALAFRDWLPSVIQSLEPYVSSEDIDKGTRWSAEMAQELEKSRYGIICVTKENVSKPWINFEAGALSRSIEKSTVLPFSSAVSPFLFDLKSSDLEGPLTQFQYVVNERADIFKLISSINGKVEVNQLPAEKIERAFEKWWPELQSALTKIAAEVPVTAETKTPPRRPDEILEELLELVRTQQRLMVSKDDVATLISSVRFDILQALGSSGIFGITPSGSITLRNLVGRSGLPGVGAGATVIQTSVPGPTSDLGQKTTSTVVHTTEGSARAETKKAHSDKSSDRKKNASSD
jgi:TIR domain